MKTFGLAVAAGFVGYMAGLFGGMLAIETFSPNTHDKSLEAAMTGAFVIGPLMAVLAVIMVLVSRSTRAGRPREGKRS